MQLDMKIENIFFIFKCDIYRKTRILIADNGCFLKAKIMNKYF